jgi:hypothetical protein
MRPFTSDKTGLAMFVLPKTELYDFDTKQGGIHSFTRPSC